MHLTMLKSQVIDLKEFVDGEKSKMARKISMLTIKANGVVMMLMMAVIKFVMNRS